MIWLVGMEEELLHRITSGSASRSSSPKTSVLMSILGNCLDHHPCAGDGLLQVIGDFDSPAPGGV